MPAPSEIHNLVKHFDQHIEDYRTSRYNETPLRRDYLDPFLKALGWDIDNSQGYAEAYRDVVHEDAINVGGNIKSPDYCCRIGGTRKFFVEAKKPSVVIKDEPAPAFQLRRYAWSAKLPLSILTDFEEFAVYDCRVRPSKGDKAATARIHYWTYKDYIDKWDEIAAIFSREAVLKGSFDKYAVATKGKKGTSEVDNAFLDEIEGWREALAKDIARNNEEITQKALNWSVQQIIDRIIFLRIAEDRGLEPYEQLKALQPGQDVYARLQQLFHKADERYNSGLFHFKKEHGRTEEPDHLTPSLIIDDKTLKDIFKNLYYPDSPYEFSVLGADILGSVYERFLGKVIRLTAGHHAKIEEKPEVKKAGGVYYTPTYIVIYIVKHTVGKLLDGKTPKDAGKLRILDPACGSGSFLIGAYQYLLDWHLDWYIKDGVDKYLKGRNPKVHTGRGNVYRLTTEERKRILINNIYGVDIDSQAVEVTKLSLLLKILEGETLGDMFHKRVLPDLGNNIKCGNSLIGPDFYDNKQMFLLDDELHSRINVFDWTIAFPEIMKSGGFDCVIGNPPYIFTRELLSIGERNYFAITYKLGWEKQNTYLIFMERMLSLLSKNGLGGYIVPNSWLTVESGKLLRSEFVNRLMLILDLTYPVFRGVSIEPCIFIINGDSVAKTVACSRCESEYQIEKLEYVHVNRTIWSGPDYRITYSTQEPLFNLLLSIKERNPILEDAFIVKTGLQAYEAGKGTPPQTKHDVSNHIYDRHKKVDETCLQYFEGKDIGRYSYHWSGMWMSYGPWLAQPREIGMFTRPRILIREITNKPPYCINATLCEDVYLNNKSILNILEPEDNIRKIKILCAVLNSRLMTEFYRAFAVKAVRKLFPKIVIKNLREFPIPKSLVEYGIRKDKQVNIIALVEKMHELQINLTVEKNPNASKLLRSHSDAIDRQLDKLVYELYGLTDEEIRIVEGTA